MGERRDHNETSSSSVSIYFQQVNSSVFINSEVKRQFVKYFVSALRKTFAV